MPISLIIGIADGYIRPVAMITFVPSAMAFCSEVFVLVLTDPRLSKRVPSKSRAISLGL